METPGILNPKQSLNEKGKYHSHTFNATAALIYRLIFFWSLIAFDSFANPSNFVFADQRGT